MPLSCAQSFVLDQLVKQKEGRKTATDPAFRWCRLLVPGFCLSLIKCGVCPKKVGKMDFLGAVKSSRQSSHAYYS